MLVSAFEAVCDEDLRLRLSSVAILSQRLFGVATGLLAEQLFHLLDVSCQGDVGVEAWVRFFYDKCRGDPCAFAFAIYDLDRDGLVGIADALRLAQEDERITEILGLTDPLNADNFDPV